MRWKCNYHVYGHICIMIVFSTCTETAERIFGWSDTLLRVTKIRCIDPLGHCRVEIEIEYLYNKYIGHVYKMMRALMCVPNVSVYIYIYVICMCVYIINRYIINISEILSGGRVNKIEKILLKRTHLLLLLAYYICSLVVCFLHLIKL